MDIESILQEAAEETYDNDDDFEKTETSNSNYSADDILKASADEVAYNDKREALKAIREAVNVVSTIHTSEVPKESRPEGSGRPPRSTSYREENRNENERNNVAEVSEVANTNIKKNLDDDRNDDDDDNDDDDVEYGDFDADMDTELLIASYRGEIRYKDKRFMFLANLI
jgi:hypothetical protein